MNISRKELDSNNLLVTLRIEKADYAEKVDKSLRNMRKKASIPGFRPGMVPVNLIKKMYGKAVMAEEINTLVSEELEAYVKENNLPLLGQPLPSETEKSEIDFDTQEEFVFHFDVGVAPEMDIALTEKDKLTYYEIAVSDEMIDNQVKMYTNQFGKHESAEIAEEGDLIKGRLVELENGAAKADGIVVESAMLMPSYMQDDAQKQLFVGQKIDSAVVFNPRKAFGNEAELASLLQIDKEIAKDVTSDFELKIAEISHFVPGEVDQALFDKIFPNGAITSPEAFREKIAEGIQTSSLRVNSDLKFNFDIRQLFIQKFSGLTFPDAFLKRFLLLSEGNDAETLETNYPKIKEDLIWHLTKNKIVEENNIKIERADVAEYAKKVARMQMAQYGMVNMEEKFVENYAETLMQKEDSMQSMIDGAINDKALDVVREKVKPKVKKISLEDFNAMMDADEKK